jgi:hypothetical protein
VKAYPGTAAAASAASDKPLTFTVTLRAAVARMLLVALTNAVPTNEPSGMNAYIPWPCCRTPMQGRGGSSTKTM